MSEILSNLTEAVKTGKRDASASAVEQAIKEAVDPQTILAAMTDAMDDVGRRFKANEIFVPEVLVAARAMKTGMELLEPVLVEAGIKPKHSIVIGTVEGDLHDIGKNLVAMMMRGSHFNVIDLGTNVTAQQFLDAARENDAELIGLSALLTTTMPSMKSTIDLIRENNLPVKVMIGGAPITDDYAREIGADGYAPDAASAVDLARQLVEA